MISDPELKATAVVEEAHLPFDNSRRSDAKLRRYRLGLALFLSAVVMLFVAFSSAYIVRRGIPNYDLSTGAYSTVWEPLELPTGWLLTGLLALGSASSILEYVRRKLSTGVSSLAPPVAALLSICFIAVQTVVWRRLQSNGLYPSSGGHIAFFYVFTGAHAVLAILGIAFLLFATFAKKRANKLQHVATDLAALYMHFVTALWVYIILFLKFA